jgi:hypothetical protein
MESVIICTIDLVFIREAILKRFKLHCYVSWLWEKMMLKTFCLRNLTFKLHLGVGH